MTNRVLQARRIAPPPRAVDQPWYGVVALPPAAVAERLRGLQDDLGTLRGEPQPHITLKMPFLLKASLAEIKARIAAVTGQLEPIVVSLRGIDHFDGPYNNAIYATVLRNPRLRNLHNNLAHTLADVVDDVYPYSRDIEQERYVPHVTIASDLTAEEMADGLQRLGGVSLRARFVVDRIQLMRREAPGRWRAIRTFPLGQAASLARVPAPGRVARLV